MPKPGQGLERPPTARPRARIDALLRTILPANRFYRDKFAGCSLDHFEALPFTTKAELVAEQQAHPPYGGLLSFPLDRYVRMHQTSGTNGSPLRWLDTAESWDWMLGCWSQMFALAGITSADRLFFPFSFGPFLGFWTAFEAASRLGCLCLAAGGMSTVARLRMMLDHGATGVFCTPTYALHLAQAAVELGVDLANSSVRFLVVAGEPGGNIPATRERIESLWGARVFDHSGMTEIGPCAIECQAVRGGLHLLESEYFAEVFDPVTHEPSLNGELVLTNLGRLGSPLVRYRTGDLVRVDPRPCPCGSPLLRLDGGILGRTDDMIPIRGNNFYPSALENVLRRFPAIVEFRVEVDTTSPLAELRVEIEPAPDAVVTGLAERVQATIRDELLFRADVELVAAGALPRFEMKARRVSRKG
jgi:phenylacetate-CoA ligase